MNPLVFLLLVYLAYKKEYSWLETRLLGIGMGVSLIVILLEPSFIWVPFFLGGTKLLFDSQHEVERTFGLNYPMGMACFIIGFVGSFFLVNHFFWLLLPVLYYLTYKNHKEGFTQRLESVIPIQ
ncbi:hypothetical protein K8R43_05735 [archaeon]|nr:hypothetical protein [archaeon]